MGHDEIIDALATAQHGVVARHQLFELGVTRRTVDLRVQSRRLVPVHPGVYILGTRRPSFESRVLAACLAAAPEGVASHRAAAALHGLEGVPRAVELSVPRGRAPRLHDVVLHRTTLITGDVETISATPCTRPARTIIDLAGVLQPAQLRRALTDAVYRGLVTYEHMERRLEVLGRQGRRGIRPLQLLLTRLAEGPQVKSDFERRLFDVLRTAGLPLPVPQFELRLPNGGTAHLDFAYPDHLLGLEADSWRHHSAPGDWARDHVRNREVTALGWRILPVTWWDLDHPADLTALVSRGLHVLLPPA